MTIGFSSEKYISQTLIIFTIEVHEVLNCLETCNTLQIVFRTQVLVCSSARYVFKKIEKERKRKGVNYLLCYCRKSSYFKHILQRGNCLHLFFFQTASNWECFSSLSTLKSSLKEANLMSDIWVTEQFDQDFVSSRYLLLRYIVWN